MLEVRKSTLKFDGLPEDPGTQHIVILSVKISYSKRGGNAKSAKGKAHKATTRGTWHIHLMVLSQGSNTGAVHSPATIVTTRGECHLPGKLIRDVILCVFTVAGYIGTLCLSLSQTADF